jgi:hypothetical protein
LQEENIGIIALVGPGVNSIEDYMVLFTKTKLFSIQGKNK